VIDHAAEQLEHELSSTGERINTTVKKLAADIITKELESFQSMFRQYQEQASKELNEGKSETDKYRDELKTKVAEDIEKEKQQLIDLLDQRLADSVISFLTETLQHEVDLGAQTDYLMSQLEAHKDELKKAVISEA
jgi:F0F1-type ATP synthase membrane subunit b/b'